MSQGTQQNNTYISSQTSITSYSNRNKDIVFTPIYHEGEYTFVLTTAHNMTNGLYVLSISSSIDLSNNINISNTINRITPISISYKILPACRTAFPIENNKSIIGNVALNEFAYFRFVTSDSRKLITVTVNSLDNNIKNNDKSNNRNNINNNSTNNNNSYGDPDLYITNKYEGLVGVTRDLFTWRSTNTGSDRVDIHPNDPKSARGGTYIIGVFGCKESNQFVLNISLSHPPHVEVIHPYINPNSNANNDDDKDIDQVKHNNNSKINFELNSNQFTYYSLKIDPSKNEKIIISIIPTDEFPSVCLKDILSQIPTKSYGQGVYTNDNFASICGIDKYLQINSINLSNKLKGQQDKINDNDIINSLPESIPLTNKLCTLAYISSSCIYPSSIDYDWRASSCDGKMSIIIDSSEFKYSNGNCYIGILGIDFSDEVDVNKNRINYTLSCTSIEEKNSLDLPTSIKYSGM
jgi:hypothetical protein